MPGRVDMMKVCVIDELPLSGCRGRGSGAAPGLEVKRSPGYERGLVRKAGEVEVGFGVELRHRAAYAKSAYFSRRAVRKFRNFGADAREFIRNVAGRVSCYLSRA